MNIKEKFLTVQVKLLIHINIHTHTHVHDIEVTNNATESDKQRETMETALNNNKTKEIYENSHLCFEEAKLKELKSWADNVYKTVENENQKCISV